MLLALLLACPHAAPPPPSAAPAAPPVPTEHEDGTWTYVGVDGSPAFAGRFPMASEFDAAGHATVLDADGWALIDTSGRVVLRPMNFDNGPDFFEEGLARYVEGGLIGFYDERGEIVIPARYEFAWPFEDGASKVGESCTFTPEGEHTRIECERWWQIDRSGAAVD